MLQHKKLEEYWRDKLPQGKRKIVEDFSRSVKVVDRSSADSLLLFKTSAYSMACKVTQKAPLTTAGTAKEFLAYAACYANPYQLLDCVAFVQLEFLRTFALS